MVKIPAFHPTLLCRQIQPIDKSLNWRKRLPISGIWLCLQEGNKIRTANGRPSQRYHFFKPRQNWKWYRICLSQRSKNHHRWHHGWINQNLKCCPQNEDSLENLYQRTKLRGTGHHFFQQIRWWPTFSPRSWIKISINQRYEHQLIWHPFPLWIRPTWVQSIPIRHRYW